MKNLTLLALFMILLGGSLISIAVMPEATKALLLIGGVAFMIIGALALFDVGLRKGGR